MAACGALGVLIALQLFLPVDAPSAGPPGLAARRPKSVSISTAPEYPAILASPIFAPDRRPGSTGALPGTGPLAGYAALGAATGGAAAVVVISTPSGEVRTLKRGDDMDGWQLIEVGGERVTFQRKGKIQGLVVGAPAQTSNQAAAQ